MNRYYYNYNISMTYQYKDTLMKFDSSAIQSCGIDFDYKTKNMPTIILNVFIDRSVLDDMIDNQSTKKVILTISKTLKDVKVPIKQNYIQKEFIYFLAENKNYNKELDYNITNINQDFPKNRLKLVTLGLMMSDLISNNKSFINGVYRDVRLIDILYHNAKNMNLLIEAPDNNKLIEQIIIPPLDTFTKLVNYLNDQQGIYDNLRYRLFYDFDKTYILSDKGNKIESKDESISSVIIYINKTIQERSKYRGFSIDEIRKSYIIDIDSNDSNIIESKVENMSYDNEVVLNNLGQGEVEGERVKIIRSTGSIASSNKTEHETIVNIVKTELDSSIFTINKEYYIKNYNKIDGITAKFILVKKKELYNRDGDSFNLVNILSFKKIS